jgi:hypothetical protein
LIREISVTEEEQDRVITELVHHNRAIYDQLWRLQGRLNALELIATLATLDFAKLQLKPFEYVQAYVEAMRQTTKGLTPDVDDQSNAPRLVSETRHAIDDYLQQLITNAGQLKGAPGNP